MSAFVTLKRSGATRTFYENVSVDNLDASTKAAKTSGYEVEVIQPAIVFRDTQLTPVEIGDEINYDFGGQERHKVVGLFMLDDGEQYAEVSVLTEPNVNGYADIEVPLSSVEVSGKESPVNKAHRFLNLIKEIVASYGQRLNEQTDIKARSTKGDFPALIIKSGPSPVSSVPYAIAVAYENKAAKKHVLIVPDGSMAEGFPIFVRLGEFVAKQLLDREPVLTSTFDDALERMDAWGEELKVRGYQAPKAMPEIDDSYDEEANEETLQSWGRRLVGGVVGDVLGTFRKAVASKEEYHVAMSPAEALRYAKDHESGAKFKGTIPGLAAEVTLVVHHEEVASPNGNWKLQRYRLECYHCGRRVELGGKHDGEGRYEHHDAYNVLKPEQLAVILMVGEAKYFGTALRNGEITRAVCKARNLEEANAIAEQYGLGKVFRASETRETRNDEEIHFADKHTLFVVTGDHSPSMRRVPGRSLSRRK